MNQCFLPINLSQKLAKTSPLMEEYRRLSCRFPVCGNAQLTYRTPVNFRESADVPIHRWFFYKEGFSPSFARNFIERYSQPGDTVFDPFAGVGTAGLEAVLTGRQACLIDINPLSILASKAKTENYHPCDLLVLEKFKKKLSQMMDYPITVEIPNPTVQRYFSPQTWESVLKVRSLISNADVLPDLLMLIFLSLIDDISTHRKDGNGVKRKIKQPKPVSLVDLAQRYMKKLDYCIEDISANRVHKMCQVIAGSNLEEYELCSKAHLVLTSPPYANCFDYSKVYLTELWVGGFFKRSYDQRSFREQSISSHVHYKWQPRNEEFGSDIVEKILVPAMAKSELWSPNIPTMLKGYFRDMGKFMHNLKPHLESGAKVGIVVGNSVYGGVPVATDLILAEMAEEAGYKCSFIKPYRRIVASAQQMAKLGVEEKNLIRESLVMLIWPN